MISDIVSFVLLIHSYIDDVQSTSRHRSRTLGTFEEANLTIFSLVVLIPRRFVSVVLLLSELDPNMFGGFAERAKLTESNPTF